jgi:SAM-dependent methyltransferase
MGNIDPVEVAYIIKYHKDLISQFPQDDNLTMGWAGDSQNVRFKVLSEIDDLNNKSILDVGCGNAKLYDYLVQLYPTIRYVGLDLLDEFLNNAIQRLKNTKDVNFYQGNFMSEQLPLLDYYLVSGALNYKNSNPLYIFQSIQHLFNSARFGLGFNLLSIAPKNQQIAVAYNKQMIFEFCKMLTPKCKLIDDYLENDYTLFLYH